MADDEGRLPRRLSAILLADMKDYSALMGEDEARAIAGVDDVGAIFGDVVPRHGGTFEISGGDRFFAIFESAVEAFEAALEIQRALADTRARRGDGPVIRVGMHLGEIVRTPFGPMGDAINVAARLQAIADPGGIAVSEDVHRAVRNHATGVGFRDRGLQRLRNIREPIRVYAVVLQHGAGMLPGGGGGMPGATRTGHASFARRALLAGAVVAAGSAALWRWGPALVGRTRMSLDPRIEPGGPLVLGVMSVQARGDLPGWMSDLTRDGLNTVLSKHHQLLVYSRQKIDFLRERRGLTEIEAAEQLGITKMIAATLSGTIADLALEVQVIDIESGLIEGSHEAHGSERQLIEMQNDAAREVMRSLEVPIDPEVARLLERRTNDRLDDYKLLTESMGGLAPDAPAGEEPRSRAPGGWWGPEAAWGGADEAAILALLERYREALESENLAEVQAIHVALPDAMRDALRKYFENAEQLRVRFSEADLVVEGDEALATFTRSDDFVDASSGVPVHLEVRVSALVARHDGEWRIRGLKKPA